MTDPTTSDEPAKEDEPSLPRPIQWCVAHPEVSTTTACGACGRWLCAQCRIFVGGESRCATCPSPVAKFRAPLVLRAALLVTSVAFAQGALHRAFWPLHAYAGSPILTEPVFALLPSDSPLAFLPSLTWRHVSFLAEEGAAWPAFAALIPSACALAYLRDDSEHRAALTWRAVLTILLAGGSLILRSDALWHHLR